MPTRRFSSAVVVTVAAVALILGTIGGGVAGAAVAVLMDDDSNGSATQQEMVTEVANPAPTDEATADVDQTTSEDAQQAQADAPTPTAEPADETEPASPTDESETDTAQLVEQVSPAVVTVINEQAFGGFGSGELQPAGTGTGFVVSEDGYIVTNNHVVEGSQGLQVIFHDGTTVDAELIGTDAVTDVAVIQVEDEVPATVPLGDSDALLPGEPVIAIGSALGNFTNTVTKGVVSGMGRNVGGLDNLVQHDASINPGNSGGPLLNMEGEVVGVNTAVVRNAGPGVSAEGLGFAIPSNEVDKIVTILIEEGSVTRPYLGIRFQPLTPQIARAQGLEVESGALVGEISTDGPVAESGIQAGDVITKINDEEINRQNSLQTLLYQYDPGDTVTLEVYRPSSGETLSFDITLGTRPPDL